MEKITFYGTRGSNSLTSAKYMEFGGATTCILLNLGETHILVDCGSGIANALEDLEEIQELHLFITHNHMDHIGGIATLLSAFENKKLHIWGKTFHGANPQKAINRVMSQGLWPVRANTYKNVEFHELEDSAKIDDVLVQTMDSNHPGGCSLYRFNQGMTSIVTAFDFCHLNGFEEKLCEFAKGATTLIYDGFFTQEELEEKPNWGHSTPEDGARIGQKIDCKDVIITHFGAHDDDTLSAWEADLQKKYPNVRFARSGQRKNDFQKMVDIGTLLNVEKDNDKLLSKIVEAMMDITGADGGTLYLLENNLLEFKVLCNKSKNTFLVRKETPLNIPAVHLDGKNICATAGREKKLINVADCYAEKDYDFSGVLKYDSMNDYHTKSVLAIPLIDENDDLIGVLQLINASNKAGEVTSFRKSDEGMLLAIANQASMAIVNASYSQKINDLLYGFVKVMSVGIDERTPYNANHTKNMVRFADKFFDIEEQTDGPFKVDSRKRREILMSIWLHDTGKILTPIDIMNKDSRLGDERSVAVENRFERRNLLLQLQFAKGEMNAEVYAQAEKERSEQLEFIRFINKTGFLADDLRAKLDELSKKTYMELDGSVCPVITEEEYYQLCIVKGTLTKEERSIMEGHVSMTQKLLAQLQFPKYYDNIPTYAGNHHEFLNGSGYPNHLTDMDLPWPCRLITVCDIFEALTAKDRPYKKPMPIDKAFFILREMADHGQLDLSVIEEFEKTQCWE